jgi:hypothetical protein
MLTASQQKLIDEIGKLLDEEGRVEAVWLAGSLGRGQAIASATLTCWFLSRMGL